MRQVSLKKGPEKHFAIGDPVSKPTSRIQVRPIKLTQLFGVKPRTNFNEQG